MLGNGIGKGTMLKWLGVGLYEHGAPIMVNSPIDTVYPGEAIWGPHNSDGEDSSLREKKICGLVYR
jgi:hypothetical protein